MPQGDLHRYFLNNGGKRLHKWLHYFEIYERYFERFRSQPITMLEIGVHGGGSLQMWKDYFHPESTIVGIDINPDCAQHAGDNVHVHIGDQSDKAFLDELAAKYGPFDILLDDGSHVSAHVIATFEALIGHMKAQSIYLIEDMHCSYWPDYGGGVRTPGTFIEYAKERIDELNAGYTKGQVPVTAITKRISTIAFHDSIVAFEFEPQSRRQHVITTGMGVPVEGTPMRQA
ncbi:MAG: class I SAM-dependent methyltransferase [Alphaproteobacteria bacterium]|nr:class I SAM-dependent methyltransferase [Alphaproteobacteria bacterium SS10]